MGSLNGLDEVTEVGQGLLGCKAARVDESHPEYLKSLDVVRLIWLIHLCSIVRQTGTVCSSYRGGSLLSLPGKVYSRVLQRKIRPTVKPWIQEEQCSFRPGHRTLDQLYILDRVLKGSW